MPAGRPAAHILAVNHAPDILDLQRNLLTEEGYRVTTGLLPYHNIDMITDIMPDLIIIDYYMWPESDNEWRLLNLLRLDRRTRHIPVIICSAAVRQVQDMQGHLNLMGIRVVFKPFDIDHLIREIKATLEAAATNALPALNDNDVDRLAADLRILLTVLLGRSQQLQRRVRAGQVTDMDACTEMLTQIDMAVRAIATRLTRLIDDHAASQARTRDAEPPKPLWGDN